jgi:hypothetical protein
VRRAALLTVALAFAGTASALTLAPPVSVTVAPREVGEGSVVTLEARSSSSPGGGRIRGISLRLARGFRANPAAVAERCRVAQAAETHSCPTDSRIGGGEATLTLANGGRVTGDLDLYRAPRQHPSELAGIVVITDTQGRKGHAVGRIMRLDPDTFRKYGLQVTLDRLASAMKPPPGTRARIRRLELQIGVHRPADGRFRHLIKNPESCGAQGWPWQAQLIHLAGDRSFYYGAIECSPAPTP